MATARGAAITVAHDFPAPTPAARPTALTALPAMTATALSGARLITSSVGLLTAATDTALAVATPASSLFATAIVGVTVLV